jgi:prepilin-type N-terminal cleavage/methylation domain-containing protein
MTSTHKRRSQQNGFTLVELLVAMSITSIIVLVLFAIVGQTSTNYRLSQRKITTLADARAFLQFIESDFASRISRTKFHWKNDTPQSSRFALTLVRNSDESFSNPDQGDLSTVVYYKEFTADDTLRSSFKVFRKKIDGLATQQLLESGNAAAFPVTDSSLDEAVLFNCLEFSLKPYRREINGSLSPWLESDPIAPDAVELTIAIIDEFSSQKLLRAEQWQALATSVDPRAREAVQQFTRIIPLNP